MDFKRCTIITLGCFAALINIIVGLPVKTMEGPVAIHLTGTRTMLSLRKSEGIKGGTPSPIAIINVWSEEHLMTKAEYFQVLDHSEVVVRQRGSYLISAQLSLRMKGGLACFSIIKSTASTEDTVLSQSVTSFPALGYATLETSFTSVTAHLDEGDRISVAIYRDDLSIDFQDGRSFLDITRLIG